MSAKDTGNLLLAASYGMLAALTCYDLALSCSSRRYSGHRRHWAFRVPTLVGLILGCIDRILQLALAAGCGGHPGCLTASHFFLGFGFKFFFGPKTLIFLLLFELWLNAPGRERTSLQELEQLQLQLRTRKVIRNARIVVFTFLFVICGTNTFCGAYITITGLPYSRHPPAPYTIAFVSQSAGLVIAGTVGFVCGIIYSRQLLMGLQGRRHSTFRHAATRIVWSCVVVLVSFWFRACINLLLGFDPVFIHDFGKGFDWLAPLCLFLEEVVPSVFVVLALGPHIRSVTFETLENSLLPKQELKERPSEVQEREQQQDAT